MYLKNYVLLQYFNAVCVLYWLELTSVLVESLNQTSNDLRVFKQSHRT
jgi:hypothetical protein